MKSFVIEVWGDFACFTRPETKVERFSYPVMTPSAARGILDAIYAKPKEFSWRIDRIEILNPIKYIALKRNEVKERIQRINNNLIKNGGEVNLIIADDTDSSDKGRTQRQTIALKDVRYRIHAHILPREGFAGKLKSFEEQATRRILNGKCYYQPYLGCREFCAYFKFSDGTSPNFNANLNMDIGYMVYDVYDLDEVIIDNASPFISLFKAKIENGVLEVPDWYSDLVKKPPREGR